jgi:hypothetical protein
MAEQRLDDNGNKKMLGLLKAGDPRVEVKTAWHAKEEVRNIYQIDDPEVAKAFTAQLGHQDESCPPEIRQLGRTIIRWHAQITAWHRARVSNGPTEAVNNLIKRVDRVAFGFRVSPRTGSGRCSTPGDPTGTCSQPSLPTEIRRAIKGTATIPGHDNWTFRHLSSPTSRVGFALK